MRRREFLVSIGFAALSAPVRTLAQRPAILTVGVLNSGSPNERAHHMDALREGLKQGGYVDGQDVAIEYRWAEGNLDRLPDLARQLVDRKVAIIVTAGTAATVAAKSATSTIPIVFAAGGDPVKLGLVASLSRPGGNVTGVSNIGASMDAKRLEILRELVGAKASFAYLVNPKFPGASALVKEIESAAAATSTAVQVFSASTEMEIETVFAGLKKAKVKAMLISADAFFISRRDQIVALAGRHTVPVCYPFREFAIVGGLISYGADLTNENYEIGLYVARILKGAKVAELPVIQMAKYELVLNRKTAKQLGLRLTRDFLARVDEVIE